jgi:hypothetical protein
MTKCIYAYQKDPHQPYLCKKIDMPCNKYRYERIWKACPVRGFGYIGFRTSGDDGITMPDEGYFKNGAFYEREYVTMDCRPITNENLHERLKVVEDMMWNASNTSGGLSQASKRGVG